MSSAAAILDFYDDGKHELMSKVAGSPEVDDISFSELSAEDHSALSDTDFGLVFLTKRASVLRKFPVNDPGNAWLSSQYFNNTYEKLAFPARFIAAKFIKEACDAYGVPTSHYVDAYASRVGNDEAGSNVFVEGSESGWMLRKMAQQELMNKEASAVELNARINLPDENFALVLENGDGTIIRKYAMPDAEHVKMAANYFDKYAMDLSPQNRHRFALSVQNRADDLDVDLSENEGIHKWASSSWNKHVHAHIEQRKSLLPGNEKARNILDKLAASLEETTPADAAEALKTFDEATNLDRYYDRGVTDPYSSTMAKEATGWSDEVDGHTIVEGDLRKAAASSKLAGYLGSSFAEQFAKNPIEVYESLPAPEKTVVKQVITGEA